jgi:hypothetical protein
VPKDGPESPGSRSESESRSSSPCFATMDHLGYCRLPLLHNNGGDRTKARSLKTQLEASFRHKTDSLNLASMHHVPSHNAKSQSLNVSFEIDVRNRTESGSFRECANQIGEPVGVTPRVKAASCDNLLTADRTAYKDSRKTSSANLQKRVISECYIPLNTSSSTSSNRVPKHRDHRPIPRVPTLYSELAEKHYYPNIHRTTLTPQRVPGPPRGYSTPESRSRVSTSDIEVTSYLSPQIPCVPSSSSRRTLWNFNRQHSDEYGSRSRTKPDGGARDWPMSDRLTGDLSRMGISSDYGSRMGGSEFGPRIGGGNDYGARIGGGSDYGARIGGGSDYGSRQSLIDGDSVYSYPSTAGSSCGSNRDESLDYVKLIKLVNQPVTFQVC